MQGLTIKEIAERLSLSTSAVKARLWRAGVKPIAYAGMCAIYAESALDKVQAAPRPGRPVKDKQGGDR